MSHSIIGIVIGYVSHHWYMRKTEALLNQRNAARRNDNSIVRSSSIFGSLLRMASARSPLSDSVKSFFQRTFSTTDVDGNSLEETRPWLAYIVSILVFCKDVTIIMLPSMLAIGLAAIIVGYLEKWKWYDALYWATMTGTTMG